MIDHTIIIYYQYQFKYTRKYNRNTEREQFQQNNSGGAAFNTSVLEVVTEVTKPARPIAAHLINRYS